MADSGQENTGNSGVRLRGFEKKKDPAAGVTPSPEPSKPAGAEVRFRRRTPAEQPNIEAGTEGGGEAAAGPPSVELSLDAASTSACATKAYRPDCDAERVLRRQWWKYDLRVKSGRQRAEEAPQKG